MDGRIRARVYLSAASATGLPGLREAIDVEFGGDRVVRHLRLDYADGGLRAKLHSLGAIRSESDIEGTGWALQIDLPRRLAMQLASLPGHQGEIVRAQLLSQP